MDVYYNNDQLLSNKIIVRSSYIDKNYPSWVNNIYFFSSGIILITGSVSITTRGRAGVYTSEQISSTLPNDICVIDIIPKCSDTYSTCYFDRNNHTIKLTLTHETNSINQFVYITGFALNKKYYDSDKSNVII